MELREGRPGPEVRLEGGTANRGLVVRVGDTVHRPQSAGSSAVQSLLRHLEDVGFEGAPRFLGTDEQGREVLTYLEGQAAIEPRPAWALTDTALVSVAELLRRYHEAVRSFDPGPLAWPTNVPPAHRGGLICHNDPNLDNIVFRDGLAVGLIDFDLASPGSVLWDVALAARLWVPLRDPIDVTDERAGRITERLRLLADAYGLSRAERGQLVSTAYETHGWCYDIVRAGAQRGLPGYVQYWTPPMHRREERGRRWLASEAAALERALS
jgi:hypothetical protein